MKKPFKKYRSDLPIKNKKKTILFLESPTTQKGLYNYIKQTKTVIEIFLNLGYAVLIKPHPGKGYSQFLESLNVTILDSMPIGELLNVENIKGVFAVSSSTLANLSNIYKKIFTPCLNYISGKIMKQKSFIILI